MDEAGPAELRARAARYRRLKQGITDVAAIKALDDLANECDVLADAPDQIAASKNTSSGTDDPRR